MATDLQDWYAWVETVLSRISTLDHGGIASRPAVPGAGDCFLATDIQRFYICYVGGIWTDVTLAYLLLAGGTMAGDIAMGGNRVTGLADPALAQDAATRAYVLAQSGLYLPLAGGTMAGDIAMGGNRVTGLADPALAQDAATRAYVLAQSGLYLPLAGGAMTGPIAMGANQITGLADPTLAQDAATRAYVLARAALYLPLAGGTMAGNIVMGGNKVTGLGAPTLANDAVRKAYADLFTLLATFNNHSARHENGGDDEISVAGLLGLLAADQHVLDAEVVAVALALAGGTMGGAITFSLNAAIVRSVNNATLEFRGGDLSGGSGAILALRGKDHADLGAAVLYTPNAAGNGGIIRLSISGRAATAVGTWSAIEHKDFVLNNALDANSQQLSNLPAPAAANDAARKAYVDLFTLLTTFNDHSARHENGGDDEISVAGLSGELADDQPVKSHGADKHTDVTRELFLPANGGHVESGTPTFYGMKGAVAGQPDLDEPRVYMTCEVPDDFVSFTKVEALWISLAGGVNNMYWRLTADYAADGEASNIHTDSPAFGVTASGGNGIKNAQEPANPLTLAALAKGDSLGIYFHRDGSNVADTLDQLVHFLGVRLTYTAEQ